VGQYLRDAGRPERAVIGIGATRYTDFGESNYLQPGDESIVVVYDDTVLTPDAVRSSVASGDEQGLSAASVLVQAVRST
jgi:hypothetical protein